jgi:hypothetical protein
MLLSVLKHEHTCIQNEGSSTFTQKSVYLYQVTDASAYVKQGIAVSISSSRLTQSTYLKYGFSISVRSWNANLCFSSSLTGTASLFLFANHNSAYSATEETMQMM